ncbi:MAG: extracellular solute-binding protein, partial [Clostridia bacterium]|nr:extracellular solute-binding protein [Clostridia bacterium]
MKRFLALACLLALLLSVLSACSGDQPSDSTDTTARPADDSTTAAPDNTDTGEESVITTSIEPLSEELKALDYSGKTITILSRANTDKWGGTEIWVEETSNDPVNDAIFYRNAFVADTLNLKEIKQVTAGGSDGIQEKVNLMVSSGDQSYDIVAASVAYGTPMINQGLMYNLYANEIDNYLDSEKPWWAQYWIEQAEMGDRLYCITGAPALSLTRMMFVMYYNKDLGDDLQLENMYDVVEEGRWTIDYLSELISPIYTSLNGDDVRDTDDQYGLAINHYENCDMFWSAFDMTMLAKDEDGWFEMNTSS